MTRAQSRAALALALGLFACGEPDAPAPAEAPASSPRDRSNDHDALVQALAAGDPDALLTATAQHHAQVRAALGPHRLHASVAFELSPEGAPASEEPAVGERRPAQQQLADELELVWAQAPPNAPRFSLTQSNDKDRGRDVIVDGDQVYTRHRNRGWYVGPRQSDVYELWLDDAVRSVHDVLALARPRLALAARAVAGGGIAGADAVELTLSRSGTAAPRPDGASPREAWRAKAEIDELSGTVLLDATTAVWLSAEITVGYSMPGPDGRPLRGRVVLRAQNTPLAPEAAVVSPPTDARPLLERTRYELERIELLDGLAGR